MSAIMLKVNGSTHSLDVDPTTPLPYVLSDDLALRGPKFGCGLGQCGACTAIVKGQAIRSCITPVQSVAGSEVTTLEGLGSIEKPHPLQQAFVDEQAAQCGFCLSGVILTAKTFWRFRKRWQGFFAAATQMCACFAPSSGMHGRELSECDSSQVRGQGGYDGRREGRFAEKSFNPHKLKLTMSVPEPFRAQVAVSATGGIH